MMKKLVSRVGLFLLLSAGLYACAILFFNNKLKQGVGVVVKPGTTAVVVGHSHPQCAFNDKFIDGLQNFSASGEAYMYTREKLLLILKSNPTIKTVFIEFTNNQINQAKDEWIWGDEELSRHYALLEPFMELNEHSVLARNNFSGYVNATFFSAKRNMYNVIMRDYDYTKRLGGYLELKTSKVDSFLRVQKTEREQQELSETNLLYLDRLIKDCEDLGVNVYLIRSPVHAEYEGWSNESLFQAQLQQRYANVTFLDFGHFSLENDEFADLEHLNGKGAKRFSKWFDQLFVNGTFQQSDPQLIIDASIDSLRSE